MLRTLGRTLLGRGFSQASPKPRINEAVRGILNQERASLTRIGNAMSRTNFPELRTDSEVLNFTARSLDNPLLLTVAGEYNVGKSSAINALIGEDLLATGVTPTTDAINYIRYGEHPGVEEEGEERVTRVSSEWLRDIAVVDTPGINSLFDEHERKTKEFVRLSDLIFFLTSSAQTFNRTEQTFLDYCQEWNKRAVLLITKKDLLNDGELAEVREFLETHFESRFGYKPPIMEVSSRMATGEGYEGSGIPEVRHYIQRHLNDTERMRIKLQNGVDTGRKMATKYTQLCADAQRELDRSLEEVANIEVTGRQYVDEMRKYLDLNYGDINSILAKMRHRAHDMIDEYVQITKLMILLNKSKFSDKFKEDVVDPAHEQLERKIFYMVDYFNQKNNRFLERVKKELADRFNSIKGLNYEADAHRRDLVDKSVSEVYSKMDTPAKLADQISGAMWNTVAIELASIFGAGAAATYIPAALLPFDPVVIPAMGALGVAGGAAMMPYKRRTIKASIDSKTREAEAKLREILGAHFDEEIVRNTSRIDAIVAPHRNILVERRDHLASILADLDGEQETLDRLQHEITRLA